jgi:hypothetical protein
LSHEDSLYEYIDFTPKNSLRSFFACQASPFVFRGENIESCQLSKLQTKAEHHSSKTPSATAGLEEFSRILDGKMVFTSQKIEEEK